MPVRPFPISQKVVSTTQDGVVIEATKIFLSQCDPKGYYTIEAIKNDLFSMTCDEIMVRNASVMKNMQWKMPKTLYPLQIALVIAHFYEICCLSGLAEDFSTGDDPIILYQETGEKAGLYVLDETPVDKLISSYNEMITSPQIKEVRAHLRRILPHRQRTLDKNLIAVENGIFDYEKKVLLPFSPEYIFLSKSQVAYNPSAQNPVIHNPDDGTDWDVESWMASLSDDPEIVELLWQIMGAIIRPNVRWDKLIWLCSTKGSNGKGTLCELMRQLCGRNACASISLSDFSKEFMLEPLVGASAIIADKNDVGTYVDKAANLKAAVTGDVIQINRKNKTPIKLRFWGLIVECLNEMPRIRDKTESFHRRQLFVPFDKCFTGQERKYIKSIYLHRKDVLEYVLHRVLHADFYELSIPQRCKDALAEYKEFNDPLRQFAAEMLPCCAWDLLPFSFLYDLYKAWMKRNVPSGGVLGKITFIHDLLAILPSFPDWECQDRKKAIKPQNRMDWPEPLIAEYNLDAWASPIRQTPSAPNYCMPLLKATYNGLLRVGASKAPPGYGKGCGRAAV